MENQDTIKKTLKLNLMIYMHLLFFLP